MNPYVANPDNIPASDTYADVPFYGRYFPRPDDFHVDPQHANSLQFWETVVDLCDESVRIYPADEGGRDVFALGSVIVKSSHLHKTKDGRRHEIDYSYADANEVQAVAIAESVLKDIRVPKIYLAGKINDCQVLVQERLPGVGLNVAWPYLSQDQKQSFKQQAREILRQLHTIKPSDGRRARYHVVRDPNILTNGRIHPLEANILFSETNVDPDMGFMHNDFTESNCIVDNDKIVGLVDWEMAGFFGWKTAGEIHRRIRTPQREHFVNANLTEERLQDIMWWNDLYDDGMPQLQE
ncbi:kinase-like domain-containing protein [Biscogniauxia marginata]|nr:kinase-like domain-containing protein [Biscogniauxia marginata]